MALSTQADRFSMLNLFQPWNVSPPVPSGSITKTDRITYLSSYTGFFQDTIPGTVEGLLHINIAWATT